MALKYADRVAESTVSTGTTDIFLSGAIDTDHATFGSQFTDGDQMPVSVFGGGKWMTFTGQYNAGANSISRVAFRRSSTGANLALSGTMTVLCGWAADDAKNTAQGAQFSLINGKIVESHASNAATFAIKTLAGTDASATDPVSVIFADGTSRSITAALSVTVSSGSTLGAGSGGAPFRVWFVLIDDAGTLRLGVRNCTDQTGTHGFPGNGILSSTAEGGAGAADTAGITYTGTAVTAKQFVIAGFAEYDSGLTTAGTWASSPTRIQMFGPHCKKPGEVINRIYKSDSSVTSTTAMTPQSTTLSQPITLTHPANPVSARASGNIYCSNGGSTQAVAQLFRDGAAFGNIMACQPGGAFGNRSAGTCEGIDIPYSTSSLTYQVRLWSLYATTSVSWNIDNQPASLILEEIMG